jgi:hypothetical protein
MTFFLQTLSKGGEQKTTSEPHNLRGNRTPLFNGPIFGPCELLQEIPLPDRYVLLLSNHASEENKMNLTLLMSKIVLWL